MFYRYEIRNNGKENILYLYLTMTYEFSKELDSEKDNKKITERCQNFIKNNSINFDGNKIYLVIDGIIIKSININENINRKIVETNTSYSNDEYYVNIKFNNDKIIKITLKEYLLGVIATNSINNLELTTLKALCLIYRTYAYKEMKKNNYIEAINEFQIYKPISYYKVIWINNYQNNINKITKAINDTDKEFLTYNNEFIDCYIHICNNGYTKQSFEIPYLEQIPSLWDLASPYYIEVKDFDYDKLEKILKTNKVKLKKISIILDKNNNIENIKIGNTLYNIKTFVSLLNLKSTDITIIINPTYVRFITKGWGNGLGLSQFGANEIAKTNCSYTSILKYYFPKIKLNKFK